MKKSLLFSLLAMACAGGLLAETTINLNDLTSDYTITSSDTYVVVGVSENYAIIVDGAKDVILNFNNTVTIDFQRRSHSGSPISLVNNSEVTLKVKDSGTEDRSFISLCAYDSCCLEIEAGSKLTIDGEGKCPLIYLTTDKHGTAYSGIGSPKSGNGGELVVNGVSLSAVETEFFTIGDSRFSKITINAGDVIQYITTTTHSCFEANAIVINGGNFQAVNNEYACIDPNFSIAPVNSAAESVYPVLLPEAFDAKAEAPVFKTYEVKNGTGIYTTYSGYGMPEYIGVLADLANLRFYLPNGTYTVAKDGKTYGCTVKDGPGTFVETPEPAILSLLLLGLGLVIRRK